MSDRRLSTATGDGTGTAGSGDGLDAADEERLVEALGDDDLLALAGVGDRDDGDDAADGDSDTHLGALAEMCTAFDYADLAAADEQFVSHLAASVRQNGAAERLDRLSAMHRECDERSGGLPDEPADWPNRTLTEKVDSLADRTIAYGDRRVGGDPYAGDESIGGMFADGSGVLDANADAEQVGALSGLDADRDGPAPASDPPNYATMLADDQVPQVQTTLDHLLDDVPLHAMPPSIRAAVRSVRGGTDPDGSALAFLQRATLDPDEYAERAASNRRERRRKRRAGVNYAGRGMARSRLDSDDDDDHRVGALAALDDRNDDRDD